MTESIAANIKLIVFQIKEKEYAIPVNQVRSIEKVHHITRVPRTAKFVKGVINLRGVVTPIINLRSRFDLDEEDFTDNTRIIIVVVNDLEVGLIVDSANDVIDIDSSAIEPSPEIIGTVEANYIKGVTKIGKRLLILLDLEVILDRNELSKMQEIEG